MNNLNGKPDDPTPKDYMFIFLGLGIVFFCIGLYFFQRVLHLHHNGVVLTGTVVDYKTEVTGYKVIEVAEYYKVQTSEGEFRVVIDEVLDIGSEVTFLHDPENRETIILVSQEPGLYELIRVSNTDLNLILLWGMSLVFFGIAGWYYKKHKTVV